MNPGATGSVGGASGAPESGSGAHPNSELGSGTGTVNPCTSGANQRPCK